MLTAPHGQLTAEERARARYRFQINLRQLRSINAYWSPTTRTVMTRSIGAKHVFGLPPGALHVGCYAFPFGADDFIGDLEDLITAIGRVATTAQDASSLDLAILAPA